MILGASYDDVAKNCAFATKFGYPYKLLCDTAHSLGAAYGADDPSDPGWPKRISFLIGPDRRILKIWDPASAATHADDVMRELGRGD